jgi:hypothetical protein
MWTLLVASLISQPAPEPPAGGLSGPPPLIVKAKVEKDQLVSITTVDQAVYINVPVESVVGGKVVTGIRTDVRQVKTKVKKAWDLKKARITTGSGEKIDLDTLRKRLATEAPVVVSADGKPISKGYLSLMRAEVIVIEAPLVPDPAPIPPK